MSGIDEQFYRCACDRSHSWFIRDRDNNVIGWLLNPDSPKREIKKIMGIGVVHLHDRVGNIRFDEYERRIYYFNCRVCGATLPDKEEINGLIGFIRRNWNDRTIRDIGRSRR